MSILSGHHGQAHTGTSGLYNPASLPHHSQPMSYPAGTVVAALDPEGRQISQFWMPLPPNTTIDYANPPPLATPPGMFPPGTTLVPIPSMHHPPMGLHPENRTRLTREQHQQLEEHFLVEPKPSTNDKKVISNAFGVPLEKINNWFQNRRAKVKQDFRKKLMASALAKVGLDATTVQGVKGKMSLPDWVGKENGCESPKKGTKSTHAGVSVNTNANRSSPTFTPTSSSRPTSVESAIENPLPKPLTDSAILETKKQLSKQPFPSELTRRLHPSVSTPNLQTRSSGVSSVDTSIPLPRPTQASIDPQLLTVAKHKPSNSMPFVSPKVTRAEVPSWPLSASDTDPFLDHDQTHVKIEDSNSPFAEPRKRHVTPEMNPGILSQLDQNNSTTALANTMSLTTLESGSGRPTFHHTRSVSNLSASPTPTSSNTQSIAARRFQHPRTLGDLRTAASMSVLPRSTTPIISSGTSNGASTDLGSIPVSAGSASSAISSQVQTPRKPPTEKTIRKVRSGIQKQASAVGLSSSARVAAGSHSRSVSVGLSNSSISPRKQSRPALKNAPSMPNMARVQIEDHPPMPAIPQNLSSAYVQPGVMPSQLIGTSTFTNGGTCTNNLGIPSPPVADCDLKSHALVSGLVPANQFSGADFKLQPNSQFDLSSMGASQVSQMSNNYNGLAGFTQTNSPPTTPHHLHGMPPHSTNEQLPTSSALVSSSLDISIPPSMTLFDPALMSSQVSDFGGFDGLSGLDGLGSIPGLNDFDPLTPVDFSIGGTLVHPAAGVSADLMYSSSHASTADSMSANFTMSDLHHHNFGIPSSSFEYTPTFQLSDDPFISPDLTH